MACYYPFLGVPDYDNRGSPYKLVGPFEPDLASIYPGSVAIPCGKCLGCRMDYSRRWADRMILELDHSKKGLFVTLTYNDENVPLVFDEFDNVAGLTLRKEDFQLFMKRLRSRKKFEDREIRFFACGEYGSNTKRPHYHAIIFGIDLDDFPDRQFKKVNAEFDSLWISEELENIWQNGFILMGNVDWKSCAYVARYVLKKATLEQLPNSYCEPEFSLMSRRPGLAAYYLQDNDVDFDFPTVKVINGKEIKIPKYFVDRLEESDPDLYNKLCSDRRRLGRDASLRRLQNTELSYQQALKIDEDVLRRRLRKLERSTV